MSYISTVYPAHDLVTPARSFAYAMPADVPADEDTSVSPVARLSTGLELAVLLTTLSGLSLTFCTIVAGAF